MYVLKKILKQLSIRQQIQDVNVHRETESVVGGVGASAMDYYLGVAFFSPTIEVESE